MCKTNEIRCPNCNRKICDATGEFHLKVKCPKCRNEFEHTTDALKHFEGTTKTLTMLNTNKAQLIMQKLNYLKTNS